MPEDVESREAAQGQRMIELRVRFWTNDLADGEGRVRPKHAWSGGVVLASQANLRTRIEYRWEKRSHESTYAVGRSMLVHVRYRLKSIVVWGNGHVRSALHPGGRRFEPG